MYTRQLAVSKPQIDSDICCAHHGVLAGSVSCDKQMVMLPKISAFFRRLIQSSGTFSVFQLAVICRGPTVHAQVATCCSGCCRCSWCLLPDHCLRRMSEDIRSSRAADSLLSWCAAESFEFWEGDAVGTRRLQAVLSSVIAAMLQCHSASKPLCARPRGSGAARGLAGPGRRSRDPVLGACASIRGSRPMDGLLQRPSAPNVPAKDRLRV